MLFLFLLLNNSITADIKKSKYCCNFYLKIMMMMNMSVDDDEIKRKKKKYVSHCRQVIMDTQISIVQFI